MPADRNKIIPLVFFYLCLTGLCVYFILQAQNIRQTLVDESIWASFEGNDWIVWEDSPQGVVAKSLHPLLAYKNLGEFQGTKLNDLKPGDRLLKINYHPVMTAEVADNIMGNSPPGEPTTLTIRRYGEAGIAEEKTSILIRNGFRIPFSFNSNGLYWKSSLWISGIGAFVALIMLLILLPIIKGNFYSNRAMLGVVLTPFLLFSFQLLHNIYLIVEGKLEWIEPEKVYMLVFSMLLFNYLIYYFHLKAENRKVVYSLPSFIAAGILIIFFIDIIFIQQKLKYYYDLIEHTTLLFFYLHVAGGLLIHLYNNYSVHKRLKRRTILVILFIFGICLTAIAYYAHFYKVYKIPSEHDLAFFSLMLFFPLLNSAFIQLQFGKVILVVARSIEYLVFLIVSIALFILIDQIYSFLLPENPYQQFLEFITFIASIIFLRNLYLANENRVNRYFISSQQEKIKNLRSFIVQIPQYTSSVLLRKDLVDQVSEYFDTESVSIWWRGEEVQDKNIISDSQDKQFEAIYRELTTDNRTVWSKNKEIAPFRFNKQLEELINKSNYSLICPITVGDDTYALLLLGKKRRGVYNLFDLELISQLIQQIQLTLNVLQLVSREKKLIEQKYRADLMALRSQINPHFLFNTLNSLTELVHESPERAEDAIEKLSFIFRYTTKESDKNLVPLGNEVKLITAYLELEKIRFGERLSFHVNIAPEVMDKEIPAFVLQTLVENCIKHGIAKVLHKGVVKVEAYQENGQVVIEVLDNGPGIDLSRIYKSTGLSNTIKRFENIYGIKNLLHFENTGEGTLVRVKIPYKTTEN